MPEQKHVVEASLSTKTFLSGPAGCGKTTAGVERMRALIESGVSGGQMLILTPQRTLQEPYLTVLQGDSWGSGGEVTLATVGGLARRMVDLFWPLAVEQAGFGQPDRPPVFLTLETAQYYMARLVRPMLEEGYFDSVTIDRNRLYSQILDNLNKSAGVGFPYSEIGERLSTAWYGDPAQRRIYADAQECATRFREYCLKHNLLDFSLQLQVFWEYLWPEKLVYDYLAGMYHHLIYDNVEEDIPRAHDLMRVWLPKFESALLIYDEGGGYRRFLGADPESGWALRELCDQQMILSKSFVTSNEIAILEGALTRAILPDTQPEATSKVNWRPALGLITSRFFPQMMDALSQEISRLVSMESVSPSEIVVVAPYLSDALRFALMDRLASLGIPARSHRPSRSLRDEPASQCLLTLATLVQPNWGIQPTRFDVAYAFMLALDMDLVRAQLLSEIVYRLREFTLSSFEQIKPQVQERITYVIGARYSTLREWILSHRDSDPVPLDHLLRRLFGEVLSQPGFGFHSNLDAARVAASLIESVQKFRLVMEPVLNTNTTLKPDQAEDVGAPNPTDLLEPTELGREYIAMLTDGVIAAQYLEGWQMEPIEAVLVVPAYTFLMMNRPAKIQFWLEPGSNGWYERLYQPLTHPYVLARQWEPGRLWTDSEEVAAGQENLRRLVSGLLLRCQSKLYLSISELSESGFEQRGMLLRAFQKVFTSTHVES